MTQASLGSTWTFLWRQILNQALAAQHLSAQGSGDIWSCPVNIHEILEYAAVGRMGSWSC